MKPLVVIPARGGSKGVPRKNILPLLGKPLINYTIEAAREVFSDEVICVSTEDEEIREVVEKSGLNVPFYRPLELAGDTAGTYEVLIHSVNFFEKNQKYFPDTLIVLQPTSPFRTGQHIKEALNQFSNSCEMVVSVKETHANPYYILREENRDGWLVKSKEGNFRTRQECPKVYELNGAIYIISVEALKKRNIGEFTRVKKYVMDEKSSIDIDSKMDWKIAELVLSDKEAF
ncbi:acylneuraminate cytidylyltransferase family protein [Cyclobacterium sp.]|uniref:acylneuraminate cytidylyltransferase family protein n=1 Tax=Cyclobacterium sp. TaxID=1966343 RepID=UPI0019ABAB86|nr:acylneuraminate cytidylyltransferase family protein [Cyclobacterium sp.]MBD3627918.1 acylneuraminate cytidylyltransferase family protein [Cyclobacterium sp.]